MSVLMNKAASLENELIDLIAAINNKLLMQKFLDWQDARNEVNDEFQIFLDSFKNIEPNVTKSANAQNHNISGCTVKCDECEGTGEVERNIHRGEEGMQIEMDVMVVCSECEGSGKVY